MTYRKRGKSQLPSWLIQLGPSTYEMREFFLLLFAVISLLLFGTLGYVVIEGWGWFDSLYMTAITVTTVGFKEVQPMSDYGRAFSIVLIFIGVGVATGVLSSLARRIIERQVKWVFRRNKMSEAIDWMSGHTIFCGYGRLTKIAVEEYCAASKEKPKVVIVERDEERALEVESSGFLVVRGDATLDESLISAGIDRATRLVSLLPSDADNLYIILTSKELNKDIFIVSRAEDDVGEKRLMRAGANKVIAPYRIGGQRVAGGLLRPHVAAFLDLAGPSTAGDLQLEEIVIPESSPMSGVSLRDSGIRDVTSIIVAAIIDLNGEMKFNPSADMVLDKDYTLICFGYKDDFSKLEQLILGNGV